MIRTWMPRAYLEKLVIQAKASGRTTDEINQVIKNLNIEVREEVQKNAKGC